MNESINKLYNDIKLRIEQWEDSGLPIDSGSYGFIVGLIDGLSYFKEYHKIDITGLTSRLNEIDFEL